MAHSAKDVHIDATVLGTKEQLSATQREHAEAVRLLYVGATRARDYLVLAPRHSDKRGLQTGWPDRLVGTDGLPLLDFLRAESDNLLVADNHEIPVKFSLLTADHIAGGNATDHRAVLSNTGDGGTAGTSDISSRAERGGPGDRPG